MPAPAQGSMYSIRKLDPRLVYAKTEAGAVEITARSLGLSQSLRRVLILLDGKRAISQLPGFVRPGDVAHLIDALEIQGLITLSGISETAPVNESLDNELLARMRPRFKDMFSREIGVVGKVFDARLNDAVSMDVLRTVLREGIDYIKENIDPNAARRVIDYVRAVLNS
jgi:hypothetical protein